MLQPLELPNQQSAALVLRAYGNRFHTLFDLSCVVGVTSAWLIHSTVPVKSGVEVL
jgi:hypothetical protein